MMMMMMMMMMPLKVRQFPLALAACVLLLSLTPTEAEVVHSIKDNCDQFLLNGKPPQIPGILVNGAIKKQQYKFICQTLEKKEVFLTLYDTKNKIPVFSAYRFTGSNGQCKVDENWKMEPQLENTKGDINMEMSDNKTPYEHQAGEVDYRDNAEKLKLTRGHLFPCSHASSNVDKSSTYTLTNIVPQNRNFNEKGWADMENKLKNSMTTQCIDNNGKIEAFVVVGAIPGNKKLNDRVNIPSNLWSAMCCKNTRDNKWFAEAHWGNNKDKAKTREVTLAELREKLGDNFKIFSNANCRL